MSNKYLSMYSKGSLNLSKGETMAVATVKSSNVEITLEIDGNEAKALYDLIGHHTVGGSPLQDIWYSLDKLYSDLPDSNKTWKKHPRRDSTVLEYI
jgi:hypothetical protein